MAGDTASTTGVETVDNTAGAEQQQETQQDQGGQESLLGAEGQTAADQSSGGDGADAESSPEGGDESAQQTGESSQTAPDTYADFALPEGIELDSAMLEAATPIFKDLGLTQEQAQKLVDFQAKQVQASSQRQVDDFNQLMDDWQNQSKTDKEFGGDAFEKNTGIARLAIDKFGTPELKQLLNDHGVGNHPEMIRFMFRVGKLLGEDVPGGQNSATSESGDRLSRFYGKTE